MRANNRAWLLLLCWMIMGVQVLAQGNKVKKGSLDLQGHRGARGLVPENTIPAMRKAIDLGVTTLEMDVVISRDSQVVLSHDPIFNPVITTAPDGRTLSREAAEALVLWQMDYADIRRYDVGLKPHPGFPRQQKMAVSKPLLCVLIDSAEAYARSKGKTMRYNIEIKSKATTDGTHHPGPAQFAELLLGVLKDKNVAERTTIQSFDVRPLQYLHQHHPDISLSYLVEATKEPLQQQLDKLGFVPQVYSPYYKNLNPDIVADAHRRGMQVIPWTINEVAEMKALVNMGVDGLISDYPDLFTAL